jgi:hypothetical protein
MDGCAAVRLTSWHPSRVELRQHRADVIAFLSRPKIDADEWAETFMAWINARCIVTRRFRTNVAALHRNFAAWCEERNDWPCDLGVFMLLLRQAQFRLCDLRGVMLVERLGLLEDV